MKNLLIVIAILGISIPTFAQGDEVHTLIGKKTRVGAYISLENQVKNFNNNNPGIYTGGRLGLVFNRYLFVGLGAYGLSNELNFRDLVEDGDFYSLSSGYGGLSIEPIIFPRQAIHLTFPLFAGVGGAEISEYNWDSFYDSDVFWMYQGGANIELNVTKWLRISGGVYYTETDNFNLLSVPKNLMEGLSYGMSLKMGRF